MRTHAMLARFGGIFLLLSPLVVAGCGSDDDERDAGPPLDVGPTCGTGQELCGNICVDVQRDRENCGACGTACADGEVCVAGACAVSCPAPQTECDGACVDTETDSRNCGGCGLDCDRGEDCIAGACVVVCPAPQIECGGACADTDTDRDNCGACANACDLGEDCVGGVCEVVCPEGQIECGGACADTDTDRDNCGACGNACDAGEDCVGGSCVIGCPDPQIECAGACVDTLTDRAHCGACGNACPSGQVCALGACAVSCPAGEVECGGLCVETDTDRGNCGGCGTTCPAGEVCAAGACGLECTADLTLCSDMSGERCVDLDTDRLSCGACDNACASGEICVAGACVLNCPAGQTECAGSCTNLASDPDNCGACAAVCASPANGDAVCSAGSCAFLCDANYDDCNLDAADGCEAALLSDPTHCGLCETACGPSQGCLLGTCYGRILVYQDSGASQADEAAAALGLTALVVSSSSEFNSALDAGNVAAVVIDAPGVNLPMGLVMRLTSFINGGGRAVFSWWELNTSPSLQTTLGVTATAPYTAFRPVVRDPMGSPDLFTGPESVPSPLLGTDRAGINGSELTALMGGSIVARLDGAMGPGAIAVTRMNRVVVNGFLPWDIDATDTDMDGEPDMSELYQNELRWVLTH